MWRIKSATLLVIVFFCFDCSQSKEDAILEKHVKSLGEIESVNCIIAKAACEGPDGKYSTLTESTMSQPYLFFEQEYADKSPLMVLVQNYGEGYGLDSAYDNAGHISTAMIGVVKAHEFHKLIIELEDRYSDFQYSQDTTYFELESVELLATDPLGFPVKFYFDKSKGRINGFTMRNPYKKSELIQVYFSEWYENEGVNIFDKVEILQGSKARYEFNYETVVFNDPTFKKKSL